MGRFGAGVNNELRKHINWTSRAFALHCQESSHAYRKCKDCLENTPELSPMKDYYDSN
jgi:hypothetical protein